MKMTYTSKRGAKTSLNRTGTNNPGFFFIEGIEQRCAVPTPETPILESDNCMAKIL